MTRQRYAAVVVAVLVVLTGCNAFGSGGESTPEPTDDVTPVDVDPSTATPTPSERPGAGTFTGISENGTVDVTALLDSHLRYLTNRSFTLEWSRRTVGGTGPLAASYERRAAVVNDSTYLERSDGTMFAGPETTYVDPDGQYRRVELSNGSTLAGEIDTAHDRPDEWFASVPSSVASIVVVPGAIDVDVVERDGRQYVRLFSRTVPDYVEAVYSDYAVRNYTATLWVASEGYIRSIHYGYELVSPEERVRAELRYVYRDVGETTISQPEWVTAIERDQTAPTTTSANGTETATPADGTETATPANGTETATAAVRTETETVTGSSAGAV
jgi:hypothetical protein